MNWTIVDLTLFRGIILIPLAEFKGSKVQDYLMINTINKG